MPSNQLSISGWQLQCRTRGTQVSCEALDQVTARSNNAVVSAISIRIDQAKKPTMVVQVPLGIAIADQIRIGFPNGVMQSLPVTTCNRNGCFGAGEVGDPLLGAMKAAKEPLRIAYEQLDDNFNKQTITVALGLTGFTTAYDKLTH